MTFEEYTRHIDWSLTVGRRRPRQTARRAASTRRELRPLGDPGERGRRRSCSTPANRGHRAVAFGVRRTDRVRAAPAEWLVCCD